jgi:hypothetical protein
MFCNSLIGLYDVQLYDEINWAIWELHDEVQLIFLEWICTLDGNLFGA